MLQWIQKHYIVGFLLLLILILCALHLSGTRNEARILPKQGVIIEKDIAVDINRNPTAALKILSASNYSESYTIDVLPILKQYNCYIVDYLIINEELYLLGCSNDTIPDMKLYPLLIFKINDTSLNLTRLIFILLLKPEETVSAFCCTAEVSARIIFQFGFPTLSINA